MTNFGTVGRTSTDRLLIEILFQLLNTENGSNTYVKKRLALAGLTPGEIQALTE